MVTKEEIEEKLKSELKTTHLEVIDVSACGCGEKFQSVIVSPEFAGKSLLSQHRLVNSILKEELKIIHAFQMKTMTPEQWDQKQNEVSATS
ncbi:Hypothetical predicted protein [Octopus vulgaris]|uniref:BolA-like protein 2 n=1 Tax=Octopus vulgaris TaxID=6645 RepID=A0AA36C251_OCTVU|nr:Hypothetical predicted protein [Octopus vulgaris]